MAKNHRICSIPGCDKPYLARGFCSKHYQRLRVHGAPRPEMVERGDTLRWIDEIAVHFDGEDCLTWPFGRMGDGYGTLQIDGRKYLAHRLVCQRVHGGPPSENHEACHDCGKGHLGCVNPRHLRWDTRAGNMADKVVHGTHRRGERSPIAKLTEDDVREIRRLAGSLSYKKIGAKFGISHTTARKIAIGERWGWMS